MSGKWLVISGLCLVASLALADTVGSAPRADRNPALPAVVSKPAPTRARPLRERRKEGNIPGLVTYAFGKTAAGVPTHIYRIMGKGGAVLDLTDYGARAVRAYKPGESGRLTEILGGPDNVIDYEKAGKLAEVYKMNSIRRPDLTGVVFTLESTNGTRKVTHTLNRQNLWQETTDLGGTNTPVTVERRLRGEGT